MPIDSNAKYSMNIIEKLKYSRIDFMDQFQHLIQSRYVYNQIYNDQFAFNGTS